MTAVQTSTAIGPDPMLRVLVVDDEPTARRRIVRLLGEIAGVTVVGECASGREALRVITGQPLDVMFLDISMPGLDGLAVARHVSAARGPLVVFVTAFDEHAIEAFRVHAADYVLKPIDRDRLRDAVEHARVAVRRVQAESAGRETADGAGGSTTSVPRLVLRDGHRTHVVPVSDVLWVESYGNYTRVYTPLARYIHRATMLGLTEELTPHGFARIHRSAIVNAARIVRVHPRGSGQYEAVLDTGLRLRVSRTYRGALDSAWRGG